MGCAPAKPIICRHTCDGLRQEAQPIRRIGFIASMALPRRGLRLAARIKRSAASGTHQVDISLMKRILMVREGHFVYDWAERSRARVP